MPVSTVYQLTDTYYDQGVDILGIYLEWICRTVQ
jgi:hypothetical protein